MFFTVIAFYVAFALEYGGGLTLCSVLNNHGPNLEWIQAVFVINLIIFENLCCMQLAFCWIAHKYNQPLMTRSDLRTGKNVSLLIFIRSRFNMRKIFDPETDPVQEELIINTSKPEEELQESLLERNEADFHLR